MAGPFGVPKKCKLSSVKADYKNKLIKIKIKGALLNIKSHLSDRLERCVVVLEGKIRGYRENLSLWLSIDSNGHLVQRRTVCPVNCTVC